MDVYFGARLLALFLLAVVLSWIDFRKNGRASTAYCEYGFIFLTGALGSMVGAINDAITSSLSPDYFIFGKGLEPEANLRLEAIHYGMQVGFSGGGVSGAILIFVSRRKSKTPPAPFGWLLRRLWIPVVGAVAGALMLPAIASRFDPFGIAASVKTIIAPNRIPDFLRVWWIHAGIYAGLLTGLVVVLALIVRRRKTAF